MSLRKGSSYLLFNHNINPACTYCSYGTTMGYGEIACPKRGIMSVFGYCGSFRYEPTKREPEVHLKLKASELSEDDFTI